MSWFSRIFGQNGNLNNGNTINGAENLNDSITDEMPNLNALEDLFIDSKPPLTDKELIKGHQGGIRIHEFLQQDFHKQGLEDGYAWHSKEMLDNQVKVIKAEFRYVMDQKTDEMRQDVLKFSNQKINVAGLPETMSLEIQLRIDLLEVNIQRLESEKELSAQEEGLVMKPIHKYRDGFLRGIKVYQKEKLFAGSTGLYI